MCYVCIIPYFTRSRVPSHISVATSVGNKSIGSMWRERFGLFSNDEDHPSFGLFMFSLPLFSLPLCFLKVSFFWCSCYLFLKLSSVLRKDLLILRAFLWEFADEYDGVDQFCPFNQTNFSRNSRIRFQLQGSWEWLEVKKLQHNFQKEVLGYNNDCGCQFLLWVFIKLEIYLILARWMNLNDSTLAETWHSLIRF